MVNGPLDKKFQMRHKPLIRQALLIQRYMKRIFYNIQHILQHFRGICRLFHTPPRVHFGVYNMYRNKSRLIFRKLNAFFFLNHGSRILSHCKFPAVKLLDFPQQRILEQNIFAVAFYGKMQMVCQRNINIPVQLAAQHLSRLFHNFVGILDIFIRDFTDQPFKLAVYRRRKLKNLFYPFFLNLIPAAFPKADSFSKHNNFTLLIIHRTDDIVIYNLDNLHICTIFLLPFCKFYDIRSKKNNCIILKIHLHCLN